MSTNPNPPKLKVAKYWAASCGGCDISLLEIGPNLLELIKIADVLLALRRRLQV